MPEHDQPSDAGLPAGARERIASLLERVRTELAAEERRVQATTPVDDPGKDHAGQYRI